MAKSTMHYNFSLPEGEDMVSPEQYNKNFMMLDGILSVLDKVYLLKGTYTGDGEITAYGQTAEKNIELGASPLLVLLDTVSYSRPMNRHSTNSLYDNDFAHDIMTFKRPIVEHEHNDHICNVAQITDNGFVVRQYGYKDVAYKNDCYSGGYNKAGKEYYYIALFDALQGNAGNDAELMEERIPVNFIGCLSALPDTYATGDMCTIDDTLMLYDGSEWITLCSSGNALPALSTMKRIGYTDDCDYKVVSSSSALSVFQTAVSEASDGDTILVMPGIYGGSGTLSIEKNINFAGIGMPELRFSVKVICTASYDEESYIWNAGTSYTTCWHGLCFRAAIICVMVEGPGEGAASSVNCVGCLFYGNDALELYGRYTDCCFMKEKAYITSGSYYAGGSSFVNCSLTTLGFIQADAEFRNCSVSICDSGSAFNGVGYMYDCDIYVHEDGVDTLTMHDMPPKFERCRMYGYDITDSYSYSHSDYWINTYKIDGTRL